MKIENIDKIIENHPSLPEKDIKELYEQIKRLCHKRALLLELVKTHENKHKVRKLIRKIDVLIELKSGRYADWRVELANMHISIGSMMNGRIDIPMRDEITGDYIKICIGEDSDMLDLECHDFEQSCSDRVPYWGNRSGR